MQLLKNAGAGYILATSTQDKLVQSLGAHRVINHRTSPDYIRMIGAEEASFDWVFDCAEGDAAYGPVLKHNILKKGGMVVVCVSHTLILPPTQVSGLRYALSIQICSFTERGTLPASSQSWPGGVSGQGSTLLQRIPCCSLHPLRMD